MPRRKILPQKVGQYKCEYVPPRYFEITRNTDEHFNGEGCQCQLPLHHFGPHLVKTNKGRYFQYEPQYFCNEYEDGCICATSSDTWDVCGIYIEITREEAEAKLKKPR